MFVTLVTCPVPLQLLHVENFESGDNTFRFTLIFLSTPFIISSKLNFTLILKLEPFDTL